MPAGPMLMLVLPDSAREFDSLTFRAHYSDSVKPTCDYAWQFGDSTKASTRDTLVSHIYDSAGTYTVQVALTDTTLHQTIAKQTALLNVMPLNAPTLTLNVPATGFWGDSCVMIVQSSLPLKSSWSYTWAFGDSTTLTSSQDTIQHYFLTPGTFTVRVALNDTVHHILLASKSATISVTARHFNLALLQSMKYVDVIWQCRADTELTENGLVLGVPPCSQSPMTAGSLAWSGTNFSYTFNKSTKMQEPSEYDSTWSGQTVSGSVDVSSSQLLSFSSSGGEFAIRADTDNGLVLGGNLFDCSSALSAGNLPFKAESDTDLVFEATEGLTKNASYSANSYYSERFGNGAFTIKSNFSDSTIHRYVILRFHN